MSTPVDESWMAISRRNARSVQTTIGWIFWDPGALRRYEARGLAPGLGYIAARAAPFAGAGADAVAAAFGSIAARAIHYVFELLDGPGAFLEVWRDRNDAVREGLELYSPAMLPALEEFGPALWEVVTQLPLVARPFAASHLSLERSTDPVLDAWHAVNFLREWRGDTHWALVSAHGLSGGEASIVHNAWLGYEGDWLSLSRGNSPQEIEHAWEELALKGLARDREVTDAGIALRQSLEDQTDQLCELAWRLLGRDESMRFADVFEPPCVALLARVDETAGVQYQPASRPRP
ncbi:MAG: hypothetical protein WAN30_09530 [Acidimicrobiales bacterium]